MSLSNQLSKLSLSLATLAGATLALSVSSTAHAATYYNCANATGCEAIESKKATSDYTKTQYPLVLAHGMGGWTRMFGLLDYYYGIPQDLMAGGADVYTTKVSSMHDTEFRGEQLLQQVKMIAALTDQEKVNLFGHSHGGIDIRYVASVAPEYVASATAVSSPEQGSKMADWVVKMVTEGSAADGYAEGEFNVASKIVLGFFDFVGGFMDVGSGLSLKELQEQDSWQAVNSLTSSYAQSFNAKFPEAMPSEYCGNPTDTNVNGVAYYSFSGIGTVTNGFDPSDYIFALTGLTFDKNDPHDGLVSSCSSRLGYVIRDDYRMNHLDSVNQVIGLTSWREVNPVSLYRSQVNRLKETDGL